MPPNVNDVIAFARRNWPYIDSADGETVHVLCDEIERLQGTGYTDAAAPIPDGSGGIDSLTDREARAVIDAQRWREIADDLAEALEEARAGWTYGACSVLERYREAVAEEDERCDI